MTYQTTYNFKVLKQQVHNHNGYLCSLGFLGLQFPRQNEILALILI